MPRRIARCGGLAAFVAASGSLPPGCGCRLLSAGCRHLPPTSTPLILDTSGGGLQHISSGVFLLKASVRNCASASDPNC